MSLLDYETHKDFTYHAGVVTFRTGYSITDFLPDDLFIRVDFPVEEYPNLLPKAVALNVEHKGIRVYPDKEHTFLVKISLEKDTPFLQTVEQFQKLHEKLDHIIDLVIKELAKDLEISEKPVLQNYY